MKNFTKLFGFAVIISFLGGIPLTSYALPSWKPLTPWQYTGSDIYFNDGNGKVAISTTTVSASLTLDVEGQIGATEYCDEDGNNCFVATDVGGTGLWESTGGVLRPVSGTIDYATEDFLFGSPQLADVGDATHDKRMFFDKSKGAFRVGGTAWTRWDDVNVGNFSVAMGNNTTASGDYSFAMGNNLTASGMYSVAMGSGGNATADYSFAMGDSQATGQFSVAMGYLAAASGGSSVAMGSGTTASGAKSVAMGWYTTASGNRSMAMGEKAKANGEASFAFGEGVIANGANSIIFGLADITVVSGSSVAANVMGIVGGAVGISDTTPDGTLLLDVEGDIGAINYCDEDGNNCFVATDVGGTGLWSDQTTHISRTGIVLVDGTFNDASLTNISGAGTKMFFYPGKAAFRAGTVSGAQWDDANIGNYSFATGYSNEASGDYSTAVGYGLTASGDGSTAFGYYSRATGAQSFSLSASLASGGGAISLGGNGDFNSGIRGQRTEASGISSFAVQNAKASGWQSIAMGREAEASTNDAVAIGRWTTASGIQSLATGYYTQANGETSFAFGEGVIANGDNSIIFGLADSTVV